MQEQYWLILIGGGAKLLGTILSKPKNPSLDVRAIENSLVEAEERKVNSLVGEGMSIIAQNLSAQGIYGGAAAQVMGDFEAKFRSSSHITILNVKAELLTKQAAQIDDHQREIGTWKRNLMKDIGWTITIVAAALVFDK